MRGAQHVHYKTTSHTHTDSQFTGTHRNKQILCGIERDCDVVENFKCNDSENN